MWFKNLLWTSQWLNFCWIRSFYVYALVQFFVWKRKRERERVLKCFLLLYLFVWEEGEDVMSFFKRCPWSPQPVTNRREPKSKFVKFLVVDHKRLNFCHQSSIFVEKNDRAAIIEILTSLFYLSLDRWSHVRDLEQRTTLESNLQ